jgi:hypothetical protein
MPVSATMGYNKRYGTNSWGVVWVNESSITATLQAFVVCATTGSSSLGQSREEFAQDLKRARINSLR